MLRRDVERLIYIAFAEVRVAVGKCSTLEQGDRDFVVLAPKIEIQSKLRFRPCLQKYQGAILVALGHSDLE